MDRNEPAVEGKYRELARECWAVLSNDHITSGAAFGIPVAIGYGVDWLVRTLSIIGREAAREAVGGAWKNWVIGLLCSCMFVILKAHGTIRERARARIATLEGYKDDLRITPNVDVSQAGSYLRIKIHNAGNAVTGIRATLINLRKTSANDTLPDTLDLRLSGSRQSPTDIGHKQTVYFDIAVMIGSPNTRCFSVIGMLGTKEQALYMSPQDRAFEVDITGTNIAGRRFEVYATVGGTVTLGPHRLTML